MNSSTLKALALDALYQVVDNSVFRILVALTALPVLASFLIGFHEDGISLLFGWKKWDYDAVLGAFPTPGGLPRIEDAQGVVIEGFVALILDYLAGALGVLFCIAATAFFVPRMIEKGAADVLFSKPVTRWVLYLSRYFAGLLFIAILATLMVSGMYLGLLLVSGYNGPGILVGALTLTYFFGLIHAVSMVIGVVTRSTVAAILLSIVFFFTNGCIHGLWIAKEQSRDVRAVAELHMESEVEDAAEDDGSAEDEAGTGEEVRTTAAPDDEPSTFVRVLVFTLDVFHYVLPKTTDADYLAKRLRGAIDAPLFRDDETRVAVFRLPEGAEELDPTARVVATVPQVIGERVWAARVVGTDATYSLWSRPGADEEVERGGRTRVRRESSSKAAAALRDALQPDGEVQRDGVRFGSSSAGSPIGATLLRWRQGGEDAPRALVAAVFRSGDRIYTALLDAGPAEASEERLDELWRRFDVRAGLDDVTANDANWYAKRFGFDSELRYNAFFSLGSSLAFTVLMLFLGWLRLSRIEF